MDHKIIPTLLSIGFIVFCLYLIFQSPIGRLNAICTPVNGIGAVFSATARMADGAEAARAMDQRFEGYFHGCRLWLWNIVYEEKYQQIKKESHVTK